MKLARIDRNYLGFEPPALCKCGGVLNVKDWHPRGVRGDSRYEIYCLKCGTCNPNGFARQGELLEGVVYFQ